MGFPLFGNNWETYTQEYSFADIKIRQFSRQRNHENNIICNLKMLLHKGLTMYSFYLDSNTFIYGLECIQEIKYNNE